jgi:hypothetical protein
MGGTLDCLTDWTEGYQQSDAVRCREIFINADSERNPGVEERKLSESIDKALTYSPALTKQQSFATAEVSAVR